MTNTLKLLFGGDILIRALVLAIIGGACAIGVNMAAKDRADEINRLYLDVHKDAIDRVTNKLEILTKEADWRAATTSAPSYTTGSITANIGNTAGYHLDGPVECRCKP